MQGFVVFYGCVYWVAWQSPRCSCVCKFRTIQRSKEGTLFPDWKKDISGVQVMMNSTKYINLHLYVGTYD